MHGQALELEMPFGVRPIFARRANLNVPQRFLQPAWRQDSCQTSAEKAMPRQVITNMVKRSTQEMTLDGTVYAGYTGGSPAWANAPELRWIKMHEGGHMGSWLAGTIYA